jgi:hypothetical protein
MNGRNDRIRTGVVAGWLFHGHLGAFCFHPNFLCNPGPPSNGQLVMRHARVCDVCVFVFMLVLVFMLVRVMVFLSCPIVFVSMLVPMDVVFVTLVEEFCRSSGLIISIGD